MAIRLRSVNGTRIALCAAETDEAPGDVYLDDGWHYALAAKFQHDWRGRSIRSEPEWDEWPVMATQKLRDAEQELMTWQERDGMCAAALAPDDMNDRHRRCERPAGHHEIHKHGDTQWFGSAVAS